MSVTHAGPQRMPTWLGLAVLAGAVLASGLLVHRFWLRELSHLTGDAQWIWVSDTLERVHPVAGMFVAPLRLASPPSGALLKVCGDREYVVYINGTPAACGWSRPGFRLDLYDVGHLLRTGDNTIAVEVRSPTPVGGLLLALDVEGIGRNVLVSGPAFRLADSFSLVTAAGAPVPVVWGSPPRFPWGYPQPQSHPKVLDNIVVEEPIRVEVEAAAPLERGGWRFSLRQPTYGYLWLEFERDGRAFVATAENADGDVDSLRNAAQPVIRVREQSRWLDPEPRLIGAVCVFGMCRPRAVEVWPVPEEFRPAAPGVVPGKHALVQRTRWMIRTPPV